jgi:hypothetical protein
MSRATESKYVEVIDLTEDDDIKEEPSIIINRCQLFPSQSTCNIIIQNQVSPCTIVHRRNRKDHIRK